MAAETSIVSGIAGRYATALFELAVEAKALDAVAADLDRLQAMIAESADLRRLVKSPIFGRDEQRRAIDAVVERAGLSAVVRRFVGVVARNRRLFALEDMIRDFRALLARHRGETMARVVSASPLQPNQLAALKAALREGVGREVNMEVAVDPELLGGLVLKVGSRMIDSSVRTKLQNLKVAMKGVA
ncbi:MAG TPA: F0F1 ATP synthase subunit delta [Candidatus Sulfotelmatobacter sp.]|nr:F0F1 ATP synthase subunit delta [Candidatus Sulfotelmatobacter sp.]